MRVCMILTALVLSTGLGASGKRPHILLLVADDLGFNDVQFRGTSAVLTPEIDRLAREGVVLDAFYGGPQCTPSRSSLLTGFYPSHLGTQHHVYGAGQNHSVPLDKTTVADTLKGAGYATHMVGKWHLGYASWEMTPLGRGFDSFYGYLGGGEDYYTHQSGGALDFRFNHDPLWGSQGTYSAFLYVERAQAIIKQHAMQSPDQPLFLYLSMQSVHAPLEAPKRFQDMYDGRISEKNRKMKAAMISVLDEAVANVTATLRQTGLADSLFTLFLSDNGGPVESAASNYPLRGGKHTVWEGGTRLTAFAHGYGLSEAVKGTTYTGLIHMVDVLATLSDAANVTQTAQPKKRELGVDADGVSAWKGIAQGSASLRDTLLYNLDNVTDDSWFGGYAAVRRGPWKLVVGDGGAPHGWCGRNETEVEGKGQHTLRVETPNAKNCTCNACPMPAHPHQGIALFNLDDDPTERTDISSQHPNRVSELKQLLETYQQSALRSQLETPALRKIDPRSNPSYFNDTMTPWLN